MRDYADFFDRPNQPEIIFDRDMRGLSRTSDVGLRRVDLWLRANVYLTRLLLAEHPRQERIGNFRR